MSPWHVASIELISLYVFSSFKVPLGQSLSKDAESGSVYCSPPWHVAMVVQTCLSRHESASSLTPFSLDKVSCMMLNEILSLSPDVLHFATQNAPEVIIQLEQLHLFTFHFRVNVVVILSTPHPG